jgi:hypothetical protein
LVEGAVVATEKAPVEAAYDDAPVFKVSLAARDVTEGRFTT